PSLLVILFKNLIKSKKAMLREMAPSASFRLDIYPNQLMDNSLIKKSTLLTCVMKILKQAIIARDISQPPQCGS
ncbi:MAG TPA: hypothetical protein VNU95_10785, partial [Candidatus Acidoferrales bacterium]|nr:hypothetical protein [Candidatus Acidoferrales bacterium]